MRIATLLANNELNYFSREIEALDRIDQLNIIGDQSGRVE
jgi:hypothetical protein